MNKWYGIVIDWIPSAKIIKKAASMNAMKVSLALLRGAAEKSVKEGMKRMEEVLFNFKNEVEMRKVLGKRIIENPQDLADETDKRLKMVDGRVQWYGSSKEAVYAVFERT